MNPEQQELLKPPVPQYAVIDFDRTMGNTNAIMSRLYRLMGDFGIDATSIHQAQQETEAVKKSFDPLPLIRHALGNDESRIKAFKDHFVSATEPPIMYDDVKPFLENLRQNNIGYSVLTYGVSKDWQEWKIAASGYEGRTITIDHEDKGAEVATWLTPEGIYEIVDPKHAAVVRSTSVCLIDDKKKAFTSLPENAIGYWLQRSDATESSKQGELPPNRDIREIGSLDELTATNHRITIKNDTT